MGKWMVAGLLLLNAGVVLAQNTGASLYATHCIACHQAGAQGAPGIAPPLAGNIGRHGESEAGRNYLVRVPLTGMVGTITVDGVRYNSNMPALSVLSDEDIAAVLGYVLKDLDNVKDTSWLTPEFVARVRSSGGTPNETHKLRGRLPPAQGN